MRLEERKLQAMGRAYWYGLQVVGCLAYLKDSKEAGETGAE